MQITNYGSGIHPREITGVSMISALPSEWYAYTNLDLATAVGVSREIDVIMVVEDRILVVDLKDWKGPIESRDGRWFNAGKDHGPSPVRKIQENAREVYLQLQEHLKRHTKGKPIIPKVQGLVVLTKTLDLSGLAETEAKAVMPVAQFTSILKSKQRRMETFGKAPPHGPLTTREWKDQLSKFFNVRKGVFVPGRRSFGEFYAESPQPVFEHPAGIYSEFNATDERKSPQLGVLRLWDFTKADPRFQTANGRSEIAGREQEVIAYLQERSDHCDAVIVDTRTRDPELGPAYWEVFERRRRLHRLVEFVGTELADLGRDERLELARQLLTSLDALHLVEAAHLDIGQHSIWVQRPSTVRLSHLMAASYPDVRTLGRDRYQFLATGRLPEDVFGEDGSAKRRDVFLVACAVHRILFGRGPASADGCAEWDPEVDGASDYLDLLGWFERALAWDPAKRFKDAGEALVAFNAATATRPSAAEVIEGLERHQGVVKTQLQLFTTYPPIDTPRETEEKIFWRARHHDHDVLVKVWKSAAWGDRHREGSRILDFLDRLSEVAISQPKGCAKILEAFWLGDAVAIIQEWVSRANLAQLIEQKALPDPETRYALLAALAGIVQDLHEQHLAHGDLKPENVLVDPLVPDDPLIVDVVDFTPIRDGEPQSSSYAPEVGDSYQRDCFAITVIAEELLEGAFDSRAERVRSSVSTIRSVEPANATLLPLIDALAWASSEGDTEARETLTLFTPHKQRRRGGPEAFRPGRRSTEHPTRWRRGCRLGPSLAVSCRSRGAALQGPVPGGKLSLAPIHSILRSAVKIGTLDSYQGKENPIVIVSLVRNNRDGPRRGGEPTIRPGFLATPNRINVAVSRAMDRLVIVGSRTRWEEGGPMDRVSEAFQKALTQGHANLIDASELLDGPDRSTPRDILRVSNQDENPSHAFDRAIPLTRARARLAWARPFSWVQISVRSRN